MKNKIQGNNSIQKGNSSMSREPRNMVIAYDLPAEMTEDLYGTYLDLLKSGDLKPDTSFKDFEKNYSDYDSDLQSKKNRMDEEILSNAIAKIDNAMSGIMQSVREGFTGGGAPKNKPREPKIKQLNLADYFKLGQTVAGLSSYERELVNNLLRKTLNPKIKEN